MGYKPGTGTVEGTDVLSTGEGGGSKFLREDGDGTCSWQTVSAGSSRSVAGDTDNAVITWVTSDNTFAAEANATFNAVTNVLAVAGQVSASHAMSSSAWHGSTLRSPDGTLCMTLNNSSGQVHFANSIRLAEDQFIGTPHDSVLIKLDGSSNGGTAIVQGQLSASIGITGSAIYAQQVSGAYLEAGYLNINNKTLIPIDAGTENTVFGRSGSLGSGNEYNVVVGEHAGNALSTGDSNVVIGNKAGQTTTDVDKSVLIGAAAAGSVMTADADGTVAIGFEALAANTTGAGNVAVGYQALTTNIDGDKNTAVGWQALETFEANSDGDGSNTAVGYDAGQAVSTGTGNTIVGASTMEKASTVAETTAVGYKALQWNNGTDGVNANVAVGSGAGQFVSTACSGTFIGYEAGGGSFSAKTTGANNTCVGSSAGNQIQGAANANVCIGATAGDAITTGVGNVIIGNAADPSAAGATNQIVIGNGATGIGDHYAVVGNSSTTRLYAADDVGATLYAGSATVQTSDERIKENIEDISLGLEFVNKLKPVQYEHRQPADYDGSLKENLNWHKLGKGPRVLEDNEKNKLRVGFIAQDVGVALQELGFDSNNNIVDVDEDTTQQAIAYAHIIAPLVKAVQELTERVKELENK